MCQNPKRERLASTSIARYLFALPLFGKEPDWPRTEAHAIDLLQRYVRDCLRQSAGRYDRSRPLPCRRTLSSNGINAKTYTSGSGKINLLARLPGRDRSLRPLLLLNHMDVVPVDKTRWTEDPFGGALKAGQIWGRGSLDMKSTGSHPARNASTLEAAWHRAAARHRLPEHLRRRIGRSKRRCLDDSKSLG